MSSSKNVMGFIVGAQIFLVNLVWPLVDSTGWKLLRDLLWKSVI